MVVTIIIHHIDIKSFFIVDLLLRIIYLAVVNMLMLRGYASMVSTWRHVQKTLPVPPARKQ